MSNLYYETFGYNKSAQDLYLEWFNYKHGGLIQTMAEHYNCPVDFMQMVLDHGKIMQDIQNNLIEHSKGFVPYGVAD